MRLPARFGVLFLMLMVLSACAPVRRPTEAPSSPSIASASAEASSSPRASWPAVPIIEACVVVLGDGTRPSTRPIASVLPPGVPLDLVPGDAAVFVFVPPGGGDSVSTFAVGPRDGRCEVSLGAGVWLTIYDAGDEPVLTFESSGGVDPIACRGTRYLEAARRACERTTGATTSPSDVVPAAGEIVRAIPTFVDGLSIAVVVADVGTGSSAAVYGFRSAAAGDDSWTARCALRAVGPRICGPALAFLAGAGAAVGHAVADAVAGMARL